MTAAPVVRRTRILATVGPASAGGAMLARMIEAGVDAFRLNFSHGTDEEHRSTLRRIRAAARQARREIAVVADLQGPKIRIGDLTSPSIRLANGGEWTLDTSGRPGDDRRASIDLALLAGAARRGDQILLGDGSVELKVVRLEEKALVTRVVHGGTVAPHAGVFLPHADLRPEILGPKDLSDLSIALREGVDFIALSFVRDGSDLQSARERLRRAGSPEVGLIAKIERAVALDHIDEILDASDGIMVARGDLGIAVPLERLALEQKRLIARANAKHRSVIVATQVLLSMVNSSRPTRAEATDVANAVLDGADAVMLSEESAVGRYPVDAVGWLDRICRATESAAARGQVVLHRTAEPTRVVEQSVAQAAVELAESARAVAIVVPTHSGRTARLVASRRPTMPVIALSAIASTRRKLALTWGVHAFSVPQHLDLLRLRALAQTIVRTHPEIRRAGPIVVTAGYPVEGRPTNLVTVVNPDEPSQRGRGGSSRPVNHGVP
jgi:pyruvate kinase